MRVISSFPREGEKSADVREVQEALHALGFDPGPIDGDFGSKTRRAIQALQMSKGLAGTGVLGSITLSLLSLARKSEEHMPAYAKIAYQEFRAIVKEVAGEKDNPRIVLYHQHTSGKFQDDETAWCSSFMNFCVHEGRKLDSSLPVETKSAAARSWLRWGKKAMEPSLYAIAVKTRGTSTTQGHVGIVVAWDEKTVSLLGGNQGNAVSIQRFNRADFLGFMTAS